MTCRQVFYLFHRQCLLSFFSSLRLSCSGLGSCTMRRLRVSVVVIVSHHVVTQLLQTAEALVTNFAGQNRVYMVLWAGLGLWILPRRYLVLRDHLLVVLCLLHVLCQQVQASEACTTAHAFQDVPRLLISSSYPYVLPPNQLPR